jgi:hypothetical protein
VIFALVSIEIEPLSLLNVRGIKVDERAFSARTAGHSLLQEIDSIHV